MTCAAVPSSSDDEGKEQAISVALFSSEFVSFAASCGNCNDASSDAPVFVDSESTAALVISLYCVSKESSLESQNLRLCLFLHQLRHLGATLLVGDNTSPELFIRAAPRSVDGIHLNSFDIDAVKVEPGTFVS